MSIQRILLLITCSVFFIVSSGSATEQEFDSKKMLSELETKLDLSEKKLSQLEPTIQSKSEELKKSIHGAVDKGFIELDELNSKLGEVSKDAQKKVKDFLNGEEMSQLKEYFKKIDRDAMIAVKERLVADISKALELTEQQIQELKPVLEESFTQLSTLVTQLTQNGSESWDEFKRQYEQFSNELREKLQDSLDDEQMKKLDKYNEEKKDKIHMVMFSA